MTTDRYGVKNRETGELFAGFDDAQLPCWAPDERAARAFGSPDEVQMQAYLLHRFGKPVCN